MVSHVIAGLLIVILTIVVHHTADGKDSDSQTLNGIASYSLGSNSGAKAFCPPATPFMCSDLQHCCPATHPVCCLSDGVCCPSGYYCAGGKTCSTNGSVSFRQAFNANIPIITIAFIVLVRSLF